MDPDASPARWKAFRSEAGMHLLSVEGSRVFDLPADFGAALETGDPTAAGAVEEFLNRMPRVGLDVPAPMPPQSFSLNVSAACNLSCGYCYAGRGSFSGAQRGAMRWPVARAAIDSLLAGCDRSSPATIGFLGGEPFVNRSLIHRATRYAAARGQALGQDVRFSVTTNGELLRADDVELIREHPFAVTVSLDGGQEVHQRQRPGSNFHRLTQAVAPLLADPGRTRISARATVIRQDLELASRFDAIRAVGFAEIGFSPVRAGPADQALQDSDWCRYLDACLVLARRELAGINAGRASAFSNLAVALKQIHRGACAPYPCGAGGGYFSVGVDGRWFACHRAIGDDRFAMGDSAELDQDRRIRFLARRHVDAQTDCRTCWARYLCSGACHQEAAARSRESCDFIRGWLEFCLFAYAGLTQVGRQVLFEGGDDGRQGQASAEERDRLAGRAGRREHRQQPA